jgi:predicted membrane channel-forming protein YqfA (hemolysin III family)
MRYLPVVKGAMWFTDVGFLCYWLITVFELVPRDIAFKDYDNPILMDWNYSFLLLDVAASVTGFASLVMVRRASANWRPMMVLSLGLTSVAGLQALNFWLLRADFSLTWWLPNAWLLLFPIPAIWALLRAETTTDSAASSYSG